MEQSFQAYIDRILKKIDGNSDEKQAVGEEMYDHLTLLKMEFLDQGFSEEESVERAIAVFGEEKKLSNGLQRAMFPFRKTLKGCSVVILNILSYLMIRQGLSLKSIASTPVDGDGIGIYFLIFEINDRVPEAYISDYATGFLVFSLIPIVISTYLVISLVKKLRQ